ncbi:linear gramicidin synthase subunit D-like [Ruditapes philippinarum]|uniref:linear gramicidin synthase subunit D-like n=1 Tax=Ruditapes philippinarum TaxID=129788 RepID=UPI00295BD8B8|nr:linear gramicidin synthase subunit D-like [Ruditapes philippinarum]
MYQNPEEQFGGSENEGIYSIIERQCRLTPNYIALKSSLYIMTYSEMETEIEKLHSLLTSSLLRSHRGEQEKSIVAIQIPNSVSYVISLLAVLKSKMAFLPIPYDLPNEKIVFMLTDSKAMAMITTKECFDNLFMEKFMPKMKLVTEHEIEIETIVVVEFESAFQRGLEIYDMTCAENDFIYIMYTSGSTGRPKGVKVKESGVINLAYAQIKYLDISPKDVVAQFASIGFDASISEMFTSLLSGASLETMHFKILMKTLHLGGIENILIQHSDIEMTAVVAHKCSLTGELSTVAFVAPKDLRKDESIHNHDQTFENSSLNERQRTVAMLWCRVFKYNESFMQSLNRQSSFRKLGGHSLHLVLLHRLIEDEIKVKLSFTEMQSIDIIQEFADMLQQDSDVVKTHEKDYLKNRNELKETILKDSELDTSFFQKQKRVSSVKGLPYNTCVHTYNSQHNILLSGATGFLGAFLLSEILDQSNCHVFCLVRETTETKGIDRIIINMNRYGLWKSKHISRVTVVVSDIAQKNLGILSDIYEHLSTAIDIVFMNAA